MKSSSPINYLAASCHYLCLPLPLAYPHYSGMEIYVQTIKYSFFFLISHSFHNDLVSCLLNKYFTSAHLSLKGHSHHQPAVMSFLFLPSFLSLPYLHDLLFPVSLPPDSFIKFRPLLLRPLCLSSCSMWDMGNEKKKKNKINIPLYSSSPWCPWQHRDAFHSKSSWLDVQ